jgi:uncharacterized protein
MPKSPKPTPSLPSPPRPRPPRSAPSAAPDTSAAQGGPGAAGAVVSTRRIEALDALRGYALCGIIFINIPQSLGMVESLGQYPEALRWFVLGRFYPIFYLLFGVGFGIFLRSAAKRVDRPRILLVRRFLALAVFGGLHHLLQPGEVLLPFAITGFVVLLPLSFLRPRANLIIGALATAAGLLAGLGGLALLPGLFALGFALADLRVPETLARRTRPLLLTALVCAAVSLLALWLITRRPGEAVELRLGLMLTSAMAVGYAALFLALLRTPVGPVASRALAPLGRMALTNYLTATLLFVPIGTALGLRGSARWTEAVLLGVAILATQMIWSAQWLRGFRYGPFEWVWRCATYARSVPMRRSAGAA